MSEHGTVYVSTDGKNFSPLGKIVGDIELTPTDEDDSTVDTFMLSHSASFELDISRYDFYKLFCGLTNNFIRFHGGRAVRWRKLKGA